MRRLALGVLAGFVALGASAMPAKAHAGDVRVMIGGEPVTFDQPPVLVNDFTLVPLRGVFEKLGADVRWDPAAKKVTVRKDDVVLLLQPGKKTALRNYEPISLDVEPCVLNGRVLVPLRAVSEGLGARVTYDRATRTVFIDMEDRPAQGTPGQPSAASGALTLEEAVQRAYAASYALKNAEADVERAREVMKKLGDDVRFAPADGSNPAAANAYTAWAKAQTAYLMAQRQVDVLKDVIAYQVKQAYNEVQVRERALELARLERRNAEVQARLAELRYEAGTASALERDQARAAASEAVKKEQQAAKAYDDAYRKLNYLLGLDRSARPVLVETPVFRELEGVDLETHVTQVVTSSTAVWLAEQQVALAELDLDLYVFNYAPEPYRAKEIDVDKARNTAEDTKRQLADTTRAVYNQIKQLEDQYHQLEAKLAQLETNMRAVEARYEAGMAIEAEFLAAKVALEQVKQQMFALTAQLDTLRAVFERPWVLAKVG